MFIVDTLSQIIKVHTDLDINTSVDTQNAYKNTCIHILKDNI